MITFTDAVGRGLNFIHIFNMQDSQQNNLFKF